MQFKLKTLLFVVLVIGILVAIGLKPLVDVRSETLALNALENEWVILVDADSKLGISSWSPKPIFRNDPWYSWPLKKIVGTEKLRRIQKLRLVRPVVSNPSLKSLSSITNVSHLTINRCKYVLTEADCRALSRMRDLVELDIGCKVEEGLEYWTDLPLKRLTCRGDAWTAKECDAIGAIESLEFAYLQNMGFTEKNLASLSNLKNLKSLCLVVSGKNGSILGLEKIKELPNLTYVSLSGVISSRELKELATICQLTSIELSGADIEDREVRRLTKNPNLKSVAFGHMQISVDTYDTLIDAGIAVEHGGLTGAALVENFCQYNQIYYPVDFEKSSITAYVKPGSNVASWTVNVSAAKKLRHDWSAVRPPNLELYPFSVEKNWRELAGYKTAIRSDDWNDETGNFYDGIHYRVNENKLEFVSRDDNRFHIKWSCKVGDEPDDTVDCNIDTIIAFKSVFVQNYQQEISLEQATNAVGKIFDLADFEPARYWNENKTLIVLDLK